MLPSFMKLGQEQATIGYASSWLVKFQREDEETALKKAIKLSKEKLLCTKNIHEDGAAVQSY